MTELRQESALDPVYGYFRSLRDLLWRPTAFFQTQPEKLSLGGPLAFALVTNWVVAAVEYIYAQVFRGMSEGVLSVATRRIVEDLPEIDGISRLARQTDFGGLLRAWAVSVTKVIFDPFWTLATLVVSAWFIFMAAKLLAPKAQPRFNSTLRFVAYGSCACILSVIPVAGSTLAWIYALALTTIGARETYRTSTGRAFMIVILPRLLIFLVVALTLVMLMIFFGFIFMKFLSG
ncbi:MAG: YIP1 family protein [Bacteriovoracia bacterium]